MSAPPALEKILCSNVSAEHGASRVYRHDIFAYSAPLQWPPDGWEQLLCWHCCRRPQSPPVPLPHEVDRRADRYRVFGVFCSWSCAKRYLLDRVPWCAGERLLLVDELAREVFGYAGPDILPAPPAHRLRCFGGDLDPEDFDSDASRQCVALSPPLIAHPEVYERTEGEPPTWSVRDARPVARPERPRPQRAASQPAPRAGTLAVFLKRKGQED